MGIIKSYNSKAIANYFLELAKRDERTIDPMGIQKLVYFAHGWALALYERPLILDRIEAWQYGPVIGKLYREFREFGNTPINRRAREVESGSIGGLSITEPEVAKDDAETRALLDRVWEVYKRFNSVQLSNLTHLPGSPWQEARDAGLQVIPDKFIQKYFKAQANGGQSAEQSSN